MKLPLTWILVADGKRAQILEMPSKGRLVLRKELAVEIPPNREINADRPGRSFDIAGEGRHAMEPPTDAHRKAKADFLRQIAQELDLARYRNEFERLIVVAPATAMGDLRACYTKRLTESVTREVMKDLTGLSVSDIQDHLAKLDVI